MLLNMDNRYGLVFPRKEPFLSPKADFTKSVFNEESDSNDNEKLGAITGGLGNNQKRMVRKIQEKALAEDPTIFQYDEIYNEIEQKRQTTKKEQCQDSKKPKYIKRLLHFASQRSIENERRLERSIQKERELEGDIFGGKDCFVTTSYRKKLEEFKQAEEREKREDFLESIGDVTRQGNLDGFYRHLYEQTLGSDNLRNCNEKVPIKNNCAESEYASKQKVNTKRKPSSRVYRKRHFSGDDTDEQNDQDESSTKKSHLHCNLDADSDFSIDTSSDSSGDELVPQEILGGHEQICNDSEEHAKNELIVSHDTEKNLVAYVQNNNATKLKLRGDSSKGKKDLWKKRTIGGILQEALRRYYERKALKDT